MDTQRDPARKISAGILVALAITSAPAFAESLFEGAPPVPEGYDDFRAAQQAVLTGNVPTVSERSDVPDSLAFHDDLVYAEADGMALELDLYVPKNTDTLPPVMLFIHGGGWHSGNKEDLSLYTIGFAELGYATASVQYRLTPDHQFPAQIHDVQCAMAWLRKHGPEHGFDGMRAVLIGGSAGGHLAMLAGYSEALQLACPGAPDAPLPEVKGIVNLYGVVDNTTPVAQAAHQVQDLIGKPYSEAQDMYELSSPIHHLDANDPPTLTFHGTIDELVPVSQADRLHERLDELGIANYYDRVEGWPHSMDLAKPLNDRFRYIIERFLQKHLPLEP